MGSSSSKVEDVAEQKAAEVAKAAREAQSLAESQLSPEKIKECEQVIQELLNDSLKAMKDEVHAVEDIIREGTVLKSLEDVVLLQYEQLQDAETVKANIRKLCDGFPALELLIDATSSMVEAVQNTKELKKLFRWQQRKTIRRVPGKDGKPRVIGLELHYKVKVVEETIVSGALQKVWGTVSNLWKGDSSPRDKKKTIIMIAFKILSKNMERENPDNFLDKEKLDALKF